MFKRCLLPAAVLLFCLLPTTAGQDNLDCFSIVAGKDATADGSVLLGHNEDNQVDNMAAMRKVPRRRHEKGDAIDIGNSGRLAQSEVTFAYWWLQMPEQDHSDGLLNEFGVALVSDSCPSREDRSDFTDGGIGGPLLRRIAIERSRTAREAIELVGSLVERFGYTASGRTFCIADPNEGWLLAVARGRHWVAQRVPDDEVAVIANTYTVATVDLEDTQNYLACGDLIDYAVARGWYDPADGPFSFEKAYAAPGSRRHRSNLHRQWAGMLHLSGEPVPVPPPEVGPLNFSVKPREPLRPEHLASALRDHYEGAPVRYKRGKGQNTPHKAHASPVCSPRANSSSIFQLRSGLPVEIGVLWWYALWQPCTTPYMPLYLGAAGVPELLRFREAAGGIHAAPAYQTFSDLAKWVDKDYFVRIGPIKEAWTVLEAANRGYQETFESYLLTIWKEKRAEACTLMTSHCSGVLTAAVERARAFLPGD